LTHPRALEHSSGDARRDGYCDCDSEGEDQALVICHQLSICGTVEEEVRFGKEFRFAV
jgi:hypothetical protein